MTAPARRQLADLVLDGSAKDLWAVVNFYNDRLHIGLRYQEKSNLVAFLCSL